MRSLLAVILLPLASELAGSPDATWYPFLPAATGGGADELAMDGWLGAPAGRHGRIRAEGERLLEGDREFRAWGVNVCYANCAPTRELADARAAFYARHGINAVRLHKYADGPDWAGIQSAGSFVRFDAAKLDRFDYFVAALKRRGIYVKLSPTFHVRPGPEDLARIPYAAELGSLPASGQQRLARQSGAVYLSTEYQDLQIAQTTALLKHRNPYTGLTYAEDPAVAFVELYNEDSVLWFGTQRMLAAVPTWRARAAAAFSAWLRERYRDEAGLLAAWGPAALNAFAADGFGDESLSRGTIVPVGNPALYDPSALSGTHSGQRRRLLDTMAFLIGLQDAFYTRFTEAIRSAGYSGEILSSNWQAGRGYSHYLNLASDARIGLVDRHNYFQGADRTMVSLPGGGSLSSGMMQVAGRPFMLSEWIHVHPQPYGVEGPAIIGAYGLGLQGWDASFIFQNKDPGTYVEALDERWEAATPQILGVFPAVSRQVLRGDVREAPLSFVRHAGRSALLRGELDFTDTVQQRGDIKTFDSDKVPAAALAIGRAVVAFSDDPVPPTAPVDLTAHRGADGTLVSATAELRWRPGTTPLDGWFSINTDGTQAVIGFGDGRRHALRHATIEPGPGFSAIYLTAQGRLGSLARGDSALIVALGRVMNTGQRIGADGSREAKGGAPILLEPVVAEIDLLRPARVEILDHAGRPTGRPVPLEGTRIPLNTGRDRSPYYLVMYTQEP